MQNKKIQLLGFGFSRCRPSATELSQ